MWPPCEDSLDRPVIERISDPGELLPVILESLDSKDARSLKTYILEHKLKEESIMWELILKIGHCVTAENLEKHSEFFDVCVRCMTYLVKIGNPKETLLAVLEQMDTFIDDVKYKSFLPLIQIALLKIPNKLFHSLDIALETISAHIRGISPPENTQLEGPEIKTFHMDTTVVRLCDILDAFLNFLEPFTVEACKVLGDGASGKATLNSKQMTFVLKKHLIRLLHFPLCHLVLMFDSESDRVESNSRQCAEKTMRLLTCLETNFHQLLDDTKLSSTLSAGIDDDKPEESDNLEGSDDKPEETKMDNEESDNLENEKIEEIDSQKEDKGMQDIVENWNVKLVFSPLGRACLLYLIHVEHLGLEKFPFVFKHDHTLESRLDSLALLLDNTTFVINFKGLLICEALVNLVSPNSLSSDSLDNPGYYKVFNDLVYVMVKCPVSDHRAKATQIFPNLLGKFEPAGRYQIYQTLLSSCSHSSLKGYLITLLKNDVADNLKLLKKEKEEPKETSPFARSTESFSGNALKRILLLAVKLPQGETSDMLENSNQIISSLNLLRFLLLADSRGANLTGVWSSLADVQKVFISPLRTGLDLSKAHYRLELEETMGGKAKAKAASFKGLEMNVSVGGRGLPALETSEKVDLVHKAINTHDIMISLLARVSEIMDSAT